MWGLSKEAQHHDSIELSPVQSSPDPVRCPTAPGAHVKMKPVIFPGGVFGYFFNPVFYCPPCSTKLPRVPDQASRCQLPLGLGWFSVEQDEPQPQISVPR